MTQRNLNLDTNGGIELLRAFKYLNIVWKLSATSQTVDDVDKESFIATN